MNYVFFKPKNKVRINLKIDLSKVKTDISYFFDELIAPLDTSIVPYINHVFFNPVVVIRGFILETRNVSWKTNNFTRKFWHYSLLAPGSH